VRPSQLLVAIVRMCPITLQSPTNQFLLSERRMIPFSCLLIVHSEIAPPFSRGAMGRIINFSGRAFKWSRLSTIGDFRIFQCFH
jgi:hypothetical protein